MILSRIIKKSCYFSNGVSTAYVAEYAGRLASEGGDVSGRVTQGLELDAMK